MVKLGRLNIKKPYIVAPMSMYSDIGLRKLCCEYGAGYSFTEQIYTSEFVCKDEKLKRKLDLFEPVGLQLLSNSASEIKKTLEMVENKEFFDGLKNVKSVDLNLGCPTSAVMKNNLGSGLLNQPKLVRELFCAMKNNTDLPVSAKIRLAINAKHKKSKPYLRIANIAKEEGLDFITVHGRSAAQLYEGEVDMNAIKEIRDNVDIPLVANGNIVDEVSGEKMLSISDAIMVGQMAVQAPFIFKQLDYYFKHGTKMKVDTLAEVKFCIEKYFEYVDTYNIGFQHVKIHMQAFLKNLGLRKAIRDLTHSTSMEDVRGIVEGCLG